MKINKGLSMMELITVVILIIILAGAMLPAIDRQLTKSVVNMEAEKLANDLRLAQQMALTRRDGYQYYGALVLPGEYYYEVIRFGPTNVNPPLGGAGSSWISIKSPMTKDNPQILDENMKFDKRVRVTPYLGINNWVFFTPQGSATSDGQALLTAGSDRVEISTLNGSYTKQVKISPTTGKVDVN